MPGIDWLIEWFIGAAEGLCGPQIAGLVPLSLVAFGRIEWSEARAACCHRGLDHGAPAAAHPELSYLQVGDATDDAIGPPPRIE